MVKINGTLLDVAGKSLTEYLAVTNYQPDRIAVECNGNIIPKSQYNEKILKNDDVIEIVSFVGGG